MSRCWLGTSNRVHRRAGSRVRTTVGLSPSPRRRTCATVPGVDSGTSIVQRASPMDRPDGNRALQWKAPMETSTSRARAQSPGSTVSSTCSFRRRPSRRKKGVGVSSTRGSGCGPVGGIVSRTRASWTSPDTPGQVKPDGCASSRSPAESSGVRTSRFPPIRKAVAGIRTRMSDRE